MKSVLNEVMGEEHVAERYNFVSIRQGVVHTEQLFVWNGDTINIGAAIALCLSRYPNSQASNMTADACARLTTCFLLNTCSRRFPR